MLLDIFASRSPYTLRKRALARMRVCDYLELHCCPAFPIWERDMYAYPRLAPILTPPTFANAASDNLFNLFVCNFWPERFNLFGVAFYYVQFRIMIC